MGVRHAVVAGGGIGGLAAGAALSRRGWRVTVCERAPVLAGIGAGIVLAPNALRALDSIGLGPEVSVGEPLAGPLGLRTPDGAWLSRTGATASRYGLPARAVHRGFLIDVLAAALPPGALRLGVSVSGVDDAGGAVVVRTSAGDLSADVVVAADGLRSVLRRQLFPGHSGPRHAGETGWRAVLSGVGLPALPAAETWGGRRAVRDRPPRRRPGLCVRDRRHRPRHAAGRPLRGAEPALRRLARSDTRTAGASGAA